MSTLTLSSTRIFSRPVVPQKWYSVYEKIGTGAYQPSERYPDDTPMKPLSVIWLKNRATYYEQHGYTVERHIEQGWFVAGKEGEPSVFGIIREIEE